MTKLKILHASALAACIALLPQLSNGQSITLTSTGETVASLQKGELIATQPSDGKHLLAFDKPSLKLVGTKVANVKTDKAMFGFNGSTLSSIKTGKPLFAIKDYNYSNSSNSATALTLFEVGSQYIVSVETGQILYVIKENQIINYINKQNVFTLQGGAIPDALLLAYLFSDGMC